MYRRKGNNMLPRYSIILLIISSISLQAQKAVVINPIANCLRNQVSAYMPKSLTSYIYRNLPASSETKIGSLRIGQMLYNEQVTVDEDNSHSPEVLVTLPYQYYDSENQQYRYLKTWMLRDDLTVIDSSDVYNYVPRQCEELPNANQSIISLKTPYTSNTTERTYSAGTYFVFDPVYSTPDQYIVYEYSPNTEYFETTAIPRDNCIQFTQALKPSERRKQFLNTVKQWTDDLDNTQRILPFVWAGASYCNGIDNDAYTNSYGDWIWPQFFGKQDGFDQSGLILRAARTAFIPYNYKTTSTLYQAAPARNADAVKPGDIICTNGMSMVISDDNTLIDSAGYTSGFAGVTRRPIHQRIQGINTLDDLREAYKNKQPLTMLNSNGEHTRDIHEYTIVSFEDMPLHKPTSV